MRSLRRREFNFRQKPPGALKPTHSSDKPESSKGAVSTDWFRLISTLSIFFMLSVTMGSQPIRSKTVDIGDVLLRSVEFILIGPGLVFYIVSEEFAVIISIVFWLLIIKTALLSSDVHQRRWFYGLLGIYIVSTILGLLVSIGMGLVAMAHA